MRAGVTSQFSLRSKPPLENMLFMRLIAGPFCRWAANNLFDCVFTRILDTFKARNVFIMILFAVYAGADLAFFQGGVLRG